MAAQSERRLWAAASCQDPEGCDRPTIARDLCTKHYQRARSAGLLPSTVRRSGRRSTTPVEQCAVDGCVQRARAYGLCSRHYRRSLRYGLSFEENAVLDVLPCEACGGTDRLHVDHNHETGELRGVLCQGCNTALGLLMEDPVRILRLALYLEKYTVRPAASYAPPATG